MKTTLNLTKQEAATLRDMLGCTDASLLRSEGAQLLSVFHKLEKMADAGAIRRSYQVGDKYKFRVEQYGEESK